jgi:predicted unusual protein kinase regulating ubiquinone biosynthesis (AarF/ABC1/UbiB family)
MIRQFKLLKLGLSSGKNLLQSQAQEITDTIKDTLTPEIEKIVHDLSTMKGSVMKLGQMLSLYSDDLFSSELKNVLRKLESKTYYLELDTILKENNLLHLLDYQLETAPIAAASLGQVHLGKIEGETFVFKIQYAGVQKAINSDIKTLKLLVRLSKVIPKSLNLDPFYDEVRKMMHQELDYKKEVLYQNKFRAYFKDSSDYTIARVNEALSGPKVIVMEYLDGLSFNQACEVLSENKRNQIARKIFRLFLIELFDLGLMQTDPNPANLLVLNEESLGLLDFGSVKIIDSNLQNIYKDLILSVRNNDFKLFLKTLVDNDYIESPKKDSYQILERYLNLLHEPFSKNDYDWGQSTIHKDALKLAPLLTKHFQVKSPPSSIVFIDRKLGGIFYLLKMLNCKLDAASIIDEFLE